MDLAEFLLARIAEDEAVAREAIGERLPHEQPWRNLYANGGGYTPHVVMGPERLLADCEAKRRIVDDLGSTGCQPLDYQGFAANRTLRALTLPYAEHPDYCAEWKP